MIFIFKFIFWFSWIWFGLFSWNSLSNESYFEWFQKR